MITMEKFMENEEFLTALVEVATPAELNELFAQYDIQLEEGLSLEDAFETIKSAQNDELNEDSLEDVNGGIALAVGIGAVGCFVASGAALSFLGGYAYQTIKNYKKKK